MPKFVQMNYSYAQHLPQYFGMKHKVEGDIIDCRNHYNCCFGVKLMQKHIISPPFGRLQTTKTFRPHLPPRRKLGGGDGGTRSSSTYDDDLGSGEPA
ncbi:hypothetical protein LguiB_001516 [Lonicera macranthoides]